MIQKIRNPEVDILRGIAAVLMILGHSFIVYPINISQIPWCAAISHFIYTFHMELFFILSGYVYHCISYRSFMKKKIERIMIPYFLFGTGALLLRTFGGAAVNHNISFYDGIMKLLFQGGGYWFLYVSFFIFLIYPLLDRYIKNVKQEIVVMLAFLCIDQFFTITNFFALDTVIHYIPYFIFGHCLKIIGGVKGQEI